MVLVAVQSNVQVYELRTNGNRISAGVDRVRVKIFDYLPSHVGVSSMCFVDPYLFK